MTDAPDTLIGKSLEWSGVHHTAEGDFADLSTHTVTYETATTCYVTAGGKRVGDASYTYTRLSRTVAVVIYRPSLYQGRTDVTLYAMFDFEKGTDRAVILDGDTPFAVADGTIRTVPTPPHPAS
ncbi:MAG: hypothetical protein AAGD34_10220 [Pseudomonadota bacterium]